LTFSVSCIEPDTQVTSGCIDTRAVLAIVLVRQIFQPQAQFQALAGLPTQQQVECGPAGSACGIDSRVADVPWTEAVLFAGKIYVGLQA